jgi:hypothetical protein
MSISLVLVLAILCGLVLAGAAVSVFALFRVQAMLRVAAAGTETIHKTVQGERDSEIQSLRDGLSGLAAQLRDLHQDAPVQAAPAAPAMPRPGLNLNKRSQALRLHRRGDTPEQIATALELPFQEVQLLLKVQQIVLSSV